MNNASVASNFLSVLESMGNLRVMSGNQLQPRGECRGRDQRRADAGDARRPAVAVVEPAEHRGTGEAAEEIRGEIEPARRAAVGGGGTADETGCRSLRKEGPDADQREPARHRREARG